MAGHPALWEPLRALGGARIYSGALGRVHWGGLSFFLLRANSPATPP